MSRIVIKISIYLMMLAICEARAGAASLRDFEYDTDPSLLQELSARVGCAAAAEWLAIPKDGELKFRGTIASMIEKSMQRTSRNERSKSWTTLTDQYLFNSTEIAKLCATSSASKKMGSGIEELSLQVSDGLIIFALGGFGSHTGEEGTLQTSRRAWESSHKELFESGKVRIERVECSFSFASDQSLCAEDMLTQIKAVMNADAQVSKKKIMLWGYSKGGISLLDILKKDPEVRARTVAAVTAGAPIRGAQVMDRMVPALDAFMSQVTIPGAPSGVGSDTILKLMQLWIGDSTANASVVLKRFSEVLEGARSMTTASRAKFLNEELAPGGLFRPDGSRIKIFHVAGIVDIQRLNGLPVLTVRNGKLAVRQDATDKVHSAEAVALLTSGGHPFSDSCVALEDAVLPKAQAIAAGLDPSLIGVLRIDHIGMRFHRLPTDFKHGVPDHAFVDSIMSVVAKTLKPAGG